jgi:fatty acid amide hydrolase 2
LDLASACAIARAIADRKLTAEAAVHHGIARIDAVNPALNAVVATRFDEALAEARAVDRAIARGESLPPFAGVPCTIKEAFALTGMPQTSGLVARKGRVSSQDGTTVRRLREAGAIPLGVTNVSELCMWMESTNVVYGRTNNPYDVRCTAGGSSGGEGSIVGSGASPFGLGSDIGGSIRMPAFFNGVFGHKASSGVVPATGQYPIAHGRARALLSTGPICRRAEDLWPLLRILAGPDGEDASATTLLAGDPAAVDPRELEVFVVRDNGRLAVADELMDAVERSALALARRGAKVRRFSHPLFARSLEIWAANMAAGDGPTFAELMGEGTAVPPLRELGRFLVRRSRHTLPAIGLGLIEKLSERFPGPLAEMLRATAELRAALEDLLGGANGRGVLLYPPYPETAPRHVRPLLFPVKWMYTAIFNALELPVTQVPTGLDRRGLPTGVQVVAAHGGDARTIAVARMLEDALGGWVPPALHAPVTA